MTGDARFIENLTSLFEAMLGDDARTNQRLAPDHIIEFMAELAARGQAAEANVVTEAGPDDRTAMRAAFLDGGLDGSARRRFETMLAASPADLQEAIASLSFLDDVEGHRATAPADLVDAAIARWEQDRTTAPPPAAILPFRRGARNPAAAAAGNSAPDFDFLPAFGGGRGHGPSGHSVPQPKRIVDARSIRRNVRAGSKRRTRIFAAERASRPPRDL